MRKLLTGTALVLAASGVQAGEIKLGMTTWVGYGEIFLAKELGYFEEGGLTVDPQIIEEASLTMAGVASGELQGTAATIDEIMKYRSDEMCFKAVYALDDSHGGDGILAPADVGSIADLKGKEVGMNEGSVSQFWFNILLKEAGMTEKDVQIVNMTADDAAAAFMAGQIPVAVTWEPHLTLAKEQKVGKVLVSSDQTPGLIVDVIALRCDTIQNQPEDVKALVAGLVKAHEYLLANQEKAYEIMAKGVGGWLSDPKDFAASAAGVQFYGAERNAAFFAGGAEGEAGKLVALGGEIWGGLGKLHMDVKYEDLVDTSFLAQ
ncbi:ABC transporter substrate-binding protein [Stagnihabitans tardus]|nr:ABC transporter substrate-binding protein [Stagnihabitans tardus]